MRETAQRKAFVLRECQTHRLNRKSIFDRERKRETERKLKNGREKNCKHRILLKPE